jgi:hypothetical protein
MRYEENGRKCGLQERGTSITTMHQRTTVLSIREMLAMHLVPVHPQLPYSPQLSLPDFFVFPKIKITLKGKRV